MNNSRQLELYLNMLADDVRRSAREVDDLLGQFKTRLDQLKTTIQNKTAYVPCVRDRNLFDRGSARLSEYPLLRSTHNSCTWQPIGLASRMRWFCSVSYRTSVSQPSPSFPSPSLSAVYSLEPYTVNAREFLSDETVKKSLANVAVLTDKHRRQINDHGAVVQPEERNAEGTWYYPDTTKNFDKLPLMYKGSYPRPPHPHRLPLILGFCAYHLASNDFKLIHGDPRIGLVQINDRYYSFSEPKFAVMFCRQASAHIEAIGNNAKLNPELIQLLDLHAQFSHVASYGDFGATSSSSSSKPQMKADFGTQTDTHFYEKNLVKNYEWNEWELRRKALKLANLRRRLTKSVQTNVSNYRRENSTQVYLPKEQAAQTKRDNYSNVPQPKVYLTGLRGHQRHDKDQFLPANVRKIDLTRDIAE